MSEDETPLTRRELRERDSSGPDATLSVEDLLAAELERQIAPYRPDPVEQTELTEPAELTEPVESAEVDHVAVTPPINDELTKPARKPARVRKKYKDASPPSTVVPAKLIATSQTEVPVRKERRKIGSRIFAWAVIALVAGLALATSVPSIALMTPEQLAYQAEMERIKFSGRIGDSQSLIAGGDASELTGRDGVSISNQVAASVGQYSAKKLKVAVPLATNPAVWPFPQVHTSSSYGYRYIFGSSNFHTGLDFDLPYGTEIRSVADGIVSYIEDPGPMCGASIMIDSNIKGTQFTTVYCHMILHSMKYTVGQTVKAGDVIGQIGLTGITTGAHLHLEVRINDVPIDPWPFLVQHAGNPPS